MSIDAAEILPEELQLALAYTPQVARPALEAFFAFDRRLAQIVSKTTEPMLGQMRLAWWRDMLMKPIADRPRGDVVLDALGEFWDGHEHALVECVDAWEILVAHDELDAPDIARFARLRSAAFAVMNGERNAPGGQNRILAAGAKWALADAAARISNAKEREAFLRAGLGWSEEGGRLPRNLRGLAVLRALASRALRAGGRPLIDGRTSALIALRAGTLGW